MAWQMTHKMQVKDIDEGRIWRVWRDVNQWHHWDTDIEFARLDQPFAVGSRFVLKPKNGPQVKIELIEVDPERSFTDLTRFPLAKMYGIHEMRKTKEGLEVSHTVRIEGPLGFLWKKIVAEKVAAGLEEQAERMVERARGLK